MCEVLNDHEGSVSIGGRLITNFCFADDIVVNAKAEALVDRLDTAATRYKGRLVRTRRKRRQTTQMASKRE